MANPLHELQKMCDNIAISTTQRNSGQQHSGQMSLAQTNPLEELQRMCDKIELPMVQLNSDQRQGGQIPGAHTRRFIRGRTLSDSDEIRCGSDRF